MKIKTIIRISNNYFKNKKRFKLHVFIVFLLMFFMLFFLITFSSTFHKTIRKIFSTESNTFITIVPKEIDLAYIKINTPSILGKGLLSDKDVEYFKELKGVKQASPTYSLEAPSFLKGRFFEMEYGSDLSVFGEERPFSDKWYNKDDINTVRAIVSSKLLDIYNSSFAPANDLPKLSEKIVVGRKLKLTMGKNSFAESGNSISTSVIIIGMDSNVEFLGITLPAVILKKIAKEINTPVTISSIKLFFETSAEMINATKEISSEGYQIKENENDIFRTLNNYLSRIDIILFLPIIFILVIIFIFIQNQLKYMLLNLKKEMGIQIAMGVYYHDVIKIWLFQYTKFIISGMIVGGSSAFLTVKFLTNSYTDKIISNMIQLEYNVEIFLISSIVIIVLTLVYMYFKILSFFRKNSIVQLMTKE
ncbi:MAG: ABC transporter permease [Candidatus Delongbacteria bacterium]|nr:ABC transporter permease [Candidatus Delongbacteria bacterium]